MNDPHPSPASNPYLASGVQDSDRDSNASSLNLVGFARVGQIITLAMVGGIVFIAVIFLTIMGGQDEPHENTSVILIVGAGLFAVNVVAALIVPMALRGKAIATFRQSEMVQPLVDPTRHRPDQESSYNPLIERAESGGHDEENSTESRSMSIEGQREALLKPDATNQLPIELRRLLQANQNALIAGLVCLEAVAIVNLVLMIIDDSKMHLIFVAFVSVGMLAMIPTVSKLRQFIDRAMQLRPTSATGLR